MGTAEIFNVVKVCMVSHQLPEEQDHQMAPQ